MAKKKDSKKVLNKIEMPSRKAPEADEELDMDMELDLEDEGGEEDEDMLSADGEGGLSGFSDEELLAEIKARGLDADLDMEEDMDSDLEDEDLEDEDLFA